MKKRSRLLLGICGGLCAAALIGLGYAGNYFYHFALDPSSGQKVEDRIRVRTGTGEMTEEEKAAKAERKKANKWMRQNSDSDYMTSRDGLSLHAYRIRNTGHRYAVICHGYRNKGSYMGLYVKKFYEMGFQILAPDARGHGKSGGDYIGMGWPERIDVADWCRRIADEDPQAQIILFGVSMGAATVMMAGGEELPSQVKAIIEDCGYTSVWDEFKVQLGQIFHTGWFPFLPVADLVSRFRTGYGFREASALEQVKKCRLPILFIHGREDTFVPFSMMEALYEAAPGRKEKLAVEKAAHGGSAQTDPKAYWGTVWQFLEQYLRE